MNDIFYSANISQNNMVRDRRHIHSNPEIGFDLPKTTQYVEDKLVEIGLHYEKIGNSGIISSIGNAGRTILLRADMDALPLSETTKLPFISNNNYGHLCGHDIHTAILLGVARILKRNEKELKGTVKLMFQPAEELGAGAKKMIEAGILDNVDVAMALHVMPDLETGKVEYKKGIASASMDTFMVNIQGKGGHSSTPHLAIDPLMIVNAIYIMLNNLVGKEVDPFETAVLTIGKCGGGTAPNIIPDTAVLEGALRCFNIDVREHVIKRIFEIIDNVTKTMRGTYTLEKISTPSVYNDEILCNALEPYIIEIIGKENLIVKEKPFASTEDFSYVSEKVPTMYIWAGAGYKGNYPLHNPNVIFDEKVMTIGAALLANCAIKWLGNN